MLLSSASCSLEAYIVDLRILCIAWFDEVGGSRMLRVGEAGIEMTMHGLLRAA